MEVIPAVDILDGKVVRLRQGRRDDATTYEETPQRYVERWIREGAKSLHLVDLNGAFGEGTRLTDLAKSVASMGVEFQVGGGIRDRASAEAYLVAGATRVVLGTAALTEARLLEELIFEFGAAKIVIAIDCRGDEVLMKGWTEASEFAPADYAQVLQSMGVRRAMITDVARDGMMQGANLDLINRVAAESRLRLQASGGIGSLDDIKALKAGAHPSVEAAILGRSLYEGKLSLAEAIAAVA